MQDEQPDNTQPQPVTNAGCRRFVARSVRDSTHESACGPDYSDYSDCFTGNNSGRGPRTLFAIGARATFRAAPSV